MQILQKEGRENVTGEKNIFNFAFVDDYGQSRSVNTFHSVKRKIVGGSKRYVKKNDGLGHEMIQQGELEETSAYKKFKPKQYSEEEVKKIKSRSAPEEGWEEAMAEFNSKKKKTNSKEDLAALILSKNRERKSAFDGMIAAMEMKYSKVRGFIFWLPSPALNRVMSREKAKQKANGDSRLKHESWAPLRLPSHFRGPGTSPSDRSLTLRLSSLSPKANKLTWSDLEKSASSLVSRSLTPATVIISYCPRLELPAPRQDLILLEIDTAALIMMPDCRGPGWGPARIDA
eukprot:755372-Hanusia_phi.AAC.4